MTKIEIFWNDDFVGDLSNISIDNFEYYGDWLPAATPVAKDFMDRVRNGDEIEVRLGATPSKLIGYVGLSAENRISIMTHP